jgi:uncharacterized zinc-type alcohol dehydrogenase-like protein
MCKFEKATEPNANASLPARRSFIKGGAALAFTPLIAGLAKAQETTRKGPESSQGPLTAHAYGAKSPTSALSQIDVTRRKLGPLDVLLDVLYCGICHSDIHQVKDQWASWNPTQYPCVPGHEIIGRVRAVGELVTKFKAGDIGGVGCMVNSCGTCDNCKADREQNCSRRATYTYNSPDAESGGYTYGGYSDTLVVREHFVIRIPPGADLAAMAPLLCAGVTTFSPMQHWKLGVGQRVGVIGLGGLGHMALKLAVARNANVTVFTTSPGKVADAKRMGAAEVVLPADEEAMKRHANQFDLLISTVPRAYPMKPFVNLLKQDATLVNVGAMEELQGLHGTDLVRGRKHIAGSLIGGIAETQEVIDYCGARKIKADVEVISPDDINRAFERVVNKDVRYRFVIDFTKGRATS